jgi:hypothetical protein
VIAFEDYFSDDQILHYVCRARAKIAKRRNRNHLIYNVCGDRSCLPQNKPIAEDEKLLQSILPPRRKWKKLDATARRKSSGQPLDSIEKTVRILKHTVRCYQKKGRDPFLDKLACFFNDVRAYVTALNPALPSPDIIPARKRAGDKVCRPIAVYPLAAKVAICITNRYLSARFDPHFESCSFAFRMPETCGSNMPKPTHHHAFARIVKVRVRRRRSDLWVAECDIQKFYDTVNHSVLIRAFNRLVSCVNRVTPEQPVHEAAVRIFMAYLASYTFRKNVLPLNDERSGYFAKRNMLGCYFGWPDDALISSGIYRSFKNTRIGVPQGGALSGLIANIILDRVDKALVKQGDKHLTYVRYCDDMIMVHLRKGRCKQYMELYQRELRRLKLPVHPPGQVKTYDQAFWQGKSRQPYKWGPRGLVPWVGFVGYEVNIRGDVRVRKPSLAKEMQKQYETVREVLNAINGSPRVSHKTIFESVANRLIQMSVGRVRMHNYQIAENELCWVNGFEALNDNKYSRIQMKRLDACRSSLLRRLRRKLKTIGEAEDIPKSKPRQIIYYGKSFSYYYHVIEKSREGGNGME